MKSLSYWIFTSGEKGIHGLDWGIKYASPIFTNHSSLDVSYRALDIKYRALLKEFSLRPRLSRPDDDKVGLLFLPAENNATLLGFIFPSIDHQQRPNTSTVVCVVPEDLKQGKDVAEVLRRIWSSNDIERIAQQNSSERPDFLQFYEDTLAVTKATKILNLNLQLKWPGENDGYIQVNERITKLTRPLSRMHQGNNILRKIIITLAGLFIVFTAAIFAISVLKDKGKDIQTSSKALISPDITSPDNKLPRPLPKSIDNSVSFDIALEREELTSVIKESADEAQRSSFTSNGVKSINVEPINDKPKEDTHDTSEIDAKVSQILAELSKQELGALESFDIVPIDDIEVSSEFGVLCSQVMNSDMIKDELSKLVNLGMPNTSKKGTVIFYWRKNSQSQKSIKNFLSLLKKKSLFSVKDLKPIQNEVAVAKDGPVQKLIANLSRKVPEKFAVRFFFRTSMTEHNGLYLVSVVKYNPNSMMTERYIAANSKEFVPIEKGTDPFKRINYTGIGLSIEIYDSLDKTIDAYLGQFNMRRRFQ